MRKKIPGPLKKAFKQGIGGLDDPKWIVAALCYLAAVALMGTDPWYGEDLFTYNQGLFVGVLAVLIVAGFCWESYILGRPGGINLILHCILIVPVALLIGRVAGLPANPPAAYGFLGQLKEYLIEFEDIVGLSAVLPRWMTDIFRNPGILILIMFTAIAFTQKKSSRRFGLIVVAFLIPTMQTLTHQPRPSPSFALGFIAMLGGIVLQFSNYRDIVAQQNILKRLHAVDDRLELKCSLRIARRAAEDGHVTEDGVMAVVQREYTRNSDISGGVLRTIAQSISQRLVREHHVLELYGDERGFFLTPYAAIFKTDSLFGEVAAWIRKIIISGIVLVWVISPIDLFPDGVPVLGAIDDALIALVGASQWLDVRRNRRYSRQNRIR